jgi:hypothetical protein
MRQQDPSSTVLELEEFLKLHPDSEGAPKLRTLIKNLQGRVN